MFLARRRKRCHTFDDDDDDERRDVCNVRLTCSTKVSNFAQAPEDESMIGAKIFVDDIKCMLAKVVRNADD
jgi:hypothetical protein